MVAGRAGRALAFSLCCSIGLLLAGASGLVIAAAGAVAFCCMTLDVLARPAGQVSLACLGWGLFVLAGVLPKLPDAPDAVTRGAEQVMAHLPARNSGEADAVSRLEQLRLACDKGLLSREQCDAASAKIVRELTGPKP